MRWTRTARIALFLGVILPVVAQSASADVLILRATGPSAARFAPGKMLPDTARITLGAHDQLVLVDAKGTRTLQGPGGYTAGAGGTGTATSLATLTGARGDRRSRIGAVRSGSIGAGPVQRPNIWFVDIATPGTACIADPGAVTLWRSASEVAGTTTVTAPTGATAKLTWIKGQAMQPWPSAIPVAENEDYRLDGAGTQPSGTALRFRLVGEAPSDLQALGGALVSRGCKGQIDMLITTAQQSSLQG